MAFFGLIKTKKSKFSENEKSNPLIPTKIDLDFHKFDEESIQKNNLEKEKNMENSNKKDNISIQDNFGSMDIKQKQYDILVIDRDEDGVRQKQINGVFASSPQELKMMYEMDGSKIQILREYPSTNANQQMPTTYVPLSSPTPSQIPFPISSNSVVQQQMKFQQNTTEAPKFFEIGGVKCKLENGRMYQEQWVRVDSTKYRLIADSTNKVVSMNGKHLETLKWIQIENTEGDAENA